MFRCPAFGAPLALLCCAPSAESQTVLTPDRVLELAERQNPEVLIARARAVQAEGALLTTRVRLPSNPELDVFLGSRDNSAVDVLSSRSSHSSSDSSLVVSAATASPQPTLPSPDGRLRSVSQRSRRTTVALAAFYRAAHAGGLRRVHEQTFGLAEEAVHAAQARYEAGETAVLDVNVARVELARARREQLAAASRLEGALGSCAKSWHCPHKNRYKFWRPFKQSMCRLSMFCFRACRNAQTSTP